MPLLSAVLCLSGLTTSCRPFNRQLSSGVLAVEGKAYLIKDERKSRLTSHSWIRPGERISAAAESRIDLMLLPGILVELKGDTEVELKGLRLEKDGDETIHPMRKRAATIRLGRGAIYVTIEQTQARSRLRIATAAGTLVAGSGRVFKIEVQENKTSVMSVRGKTTFEPAETGNRIEIAPGYFAEWPGTVAGPQPAAQAGVKARAEIRRILAAEKHLRRLGEEQSSAVSPWRELADQK